MNKGYYLVNDYGVVVSSVGSSDGYYPIEVISHILRIPKNEVQEAVKNQTWFYAGGMDIQVKYGTHKEDKEKVTYTIKTIEKPKKKCYTIKNGKTVNIEDSKSKNSITLF